MKIKLIPVIFFFVILSCSFSSGYSVEPVWEELTYFQGDVAQFIIKGDANQTNVSCIIRHYYQSDPLSDDAEITAMKWFDIPQLDNNGTYLFEFALNDTNGFSKTGGYNVTFIFGVDVLNETFVEVWTAPRVSHYLKVDLSWEYIISGFDNIIADNAKTQAITKAENDAWRNFSGFGIGLLYAIGGLYLLDRYVKKRTGKSIIRRVYDFAVNVTFKPLSDPASTYHKSYDRTPMVKKKHDLMEDISKARSGMDEIKEIDEHRKKVVVKTNSHLMRASLKRNDILKKEPDSKFILALDKTLESDLGGKLPPIRPYKRSELFGSEV